MPQVTVTLSIDVTLDIPEKYAKRVSEEDIIEMARSAIPDSSVTPNNMPNGVQVTLDSSCQEEDGEPVFADVYHVEHDTFNDPLIEFLEEGFTKADATES